MKIPLNRAQAEIVEKKSRFIATVSYIENEKAAEQFLTEMKKKYWDAKHNCSAWYLKEPCEVMRFNDDGEPKRTAGKPILDVICTSGYSNTAIVVTRYFGGVLLGTGGLVRAYTRAAQEALRVTETGVVQAAKRIKISNSYQDEERVRSFLEDHQLTIEKSDYSEAVTRTIVMRADEQEGLCLELTNLTAGRVNYKYDEDCIMIVACADNHT